MGLFDSLYRPPSYQKGVQESDIRQEEIASDIEFIRIDEKGQKVESLKIQTVPLELEDQSTSSFPVIPSVGRNNPFYNYTGGEDILVMELDWYSNEGLRQDVIRNCTWVKSLTKANGYKEEPPRIILRFGNLFKFERWIVTDAPFKLSLFDKELGMLPRQAFQRVTLKRVTNANTLTDDIRKFNDLNDIKLDGPWIA